MSYLNSDPERRVRITYSASLQFLSSDYWTQIYSALSSQFPLLNLHWKYASNSPVRTIQQLEVELVSLETLKEEGVSQIPLYLLDRPLVNLYVVACDDNEVYRTVVRKQIKDWQTSILPHKHQEWMILYVIRPDSKMNSGGLSKLRGTILDRIKSDFNMDKRDRCVQLIWSTGSDSPEAWAEVMMKLKEGILSAFSSAVAQRQEEIHRLESQRQMPGWNFCTYYLIKESLAVSFEDMSLLDDAQDQYDELEISLSLALGQKNLLWFGKVIELAPSDDSLPLLSLDKKPYRDLILANTISVFDFKVYLLSRQCNLMAKRGKIAEVGRLAIRFLTTFSQRLRKETLPRHFLESWIFSSALSVVEKCDILIKDLDLGAGVAYNSIKGELLELARHQLDKIGVNLTYLPSKIPFRYNMDGAQSYSLEQKAFQSTNSDIARCVADEAAFFEIYVKITNRAIDAFAKAGRRKFALRLHGSLAALDLHRGRQASATQIFTSLPAHYIPYRWSSVASYMLYRSVDLRHKTNHCHDRDWIQSAFAIVKLLINNQDGFLIDVEDKKSYSESLIKTAIMAAGELESELQIQDHPSFSLRVETDQGKCAGDRDGLNVDILITNHMEIDISASQISLIMKGRNSDILEFTVSAKTVVKGSNVFTLFNPTPVSGLFAIDYAEIRVSQLLLRWNYSSTGLHTMVARKPVRKLIAFPPDNDALKVELRRPYFINVGAGKNLLLSISSGRNKIESCIMKISSTHAELKVEEGSLSGNSKCSATVELLNGRAAIYGLNRHCALSLLIPYTQQSPSDLLTSTVNVEYKTYDDKALTRELTIVQTANMALDIMINVQDYFRGSRLFSKFTISSMTHQHIRVKSAELVVPKEDESAPIVTSNALFNNCIQTATPAAPISYIFQIERKMNEPSDVLQLRLKYCSLREEINELLSRRIGTQLQNMPLEARSEVVLSALSALESDSSWITPYETTGELIFPREFDTNGILQELSSESRKELLNGITADYKFDGWHEVVVPVALPDVDIVAETRLYITEDPVSKEMLATEDFLPIFTGQRITCVVSIKTSFRWRKDSELAEEYKLIYQIDDIGSDWLISGKDRDFFSAKDDMLYTDTITIIPARHGLLSLPRITVQPSHDSDEYIPTIENYHTHGAEKILVRPAEENMNRRSSLVKKEEN